MNTVRRERQDQAPEAEAAIGAFLVGFIGDPEVISEEAKWRLHDVLTNAGSLLGEVVAEAWAQSAHAPPGLDLDAEESTSESPSAAPAPGDPCADS
jgi:hypothetical protein